ncbi:MAG: tetratricopeptide repeat protein [Chitinophagaceae bacterium]|nr:tetratricopeptide repeat protein [Chitinophagaceae bacterium]
MPLAARLFLLLLCTAPFASFAQDKGGETKDAPVKKTVKGEVYALIIGISSYPYIKPLSYADKDAELFREFLLSPAGGRVKPSNIVTLLNDQAKQGNIIAKGFSWLKNKNPHKDDRVYIYLSGHGDAINEKNHFFLAYDCIGGDPLNYMITGAVQMYNIKTAIIEPLTKAGVEVVLILDACRTNELPGGEKGQQYFSSSVKSVAEERVGEIIMLSTGPGQVAVESAKVGNGHGLFTYYLIEGLSGFADDDRDGKISLIELTEWVGKKVRTEARVEFSRTQIPYFCCSDFNDKTVSLVDSSYLKSWIAAKEMAKLAGKEDLTITTKKVGEKSNSGNEKTDTSLIALFNLFNKAIRNDRLIGNESAEGYYAEMLKQWPQHSLTDDAKYSLATEFINYGQQKINLFLNGKDITYVNKMRQKMQSAVSTANLDDSSGVSKKTTSAASIMQEQVDRIEKIATVQYKDAAYMMEKAIALLQQDSFLIQSLYPKLWFLKAKSYHSGEDKAMTYSSAMEYCRRALAADSNAAYTYHMLGLLYREKRKDSCINFFEKAISLAPQWSYPYQQLAYHYYDGYENAKAEKYFFRAIAADSSQTHLVRNLADLYKGEGKKEKALEYYLKAANEDPSDPENFNSLGVFYYEGKKYKEAEEYYKKAIQVKKDYFYPLYNMALLNEYAFLNYEQAESYYRKVLELKKNDKQALSGLAGLYSKQKKLKQAEGEYQNLVNADPRDPGNQLYLGNFYYGDIKDFVKAEQAYIAAIKIDSNYTFAYHNLGLIYSYKKPDYSKAENYFKKALKTDPNYVQASNQLAELYVKQSRFKDAELQYKYSMTVKPANEENCNDLGVFYYDRKMPDSALKYFSEAIKIKPDFVLPYNNLALVYETFYRNYNKAEQCYNEALRINPSYSLALRNLALLYKKTGKYKKAEDIYLKLIATEPEKYNTWLAAGNFYYDESKDAEKTEKYYLKALSIDSTDPALYNNLGLVYENLKKDYKKAERYYLQTIKISPKYSLGYRNLAAMHEKQKNYVQAEKYLMQAIKLQPDVIENYNVTGIFYYDRKKREEAEKYFRKALQLDSNFVYAWHNLALVYQFLFMDTAKAEQYYLRAIKADPGYTASIDNLAKIYKQQKKSRLLEQLYVKAVKDNPGKPEFANTLGIYYYDLSLAGKAEEQFNVAIKADSNFVYAWHNLALVHQFLNKDTSKAEKYYLQAIMVDSAYAASIDNLGKIYKQQKRQGLFEQLYSNAVRNNPGKPEFANSLGIFYYDQLQAGKAEEQFRHAIKADSNFVYAWYNLALVYQYLNRDTSKAEQYYLRAIKADSTYTTAIDDLARIYKAQKKVDQLEKLYLKAAKDNPLNKDLMNSAGIFYYNNSYARKAEEYFRRAVKIDSAYVYAWYNLGLVFQHLDRDSSKAEQFYLKALQADPLYSPAFDNLAKLYKQRQKNEKVEELYLRHKKPGTSNASFYNELGIFHYGFKDARTAEMYYKKALQADSLFEYAYNNLGLVYEFLYHDSITAEKYYLRTTTVNPGYISGYDNLGLLYLGKLNQPVKAQKIFETLVKKQPDSNRHYYNLACAFARQNNGKDALHYLEISIQKGYRNFEWIRSDSDLVILHGTKELGELIRKYNR